MGMRVDLAGLAKNAAQCIKGLARCLSARDRGNADYYAFSLEEMSQHAAETKAGKHTLHEFAGVYCLGPEVMPLVLTEVDYPTE